MLRSARLPRRSRRQGLRADALAAWRPSATPDGLRCAVPLPVRAIPPESPEFAMSEKSHVSLEQHVCAVCGQVFDTGALLLDRRLRPSLERHTTTSWDLCAEHKKLNEEGFVALIECDPARSGAGMGTRRLQIGQAYRTGRLAHLKREAFSKVFNVEVDPQQACVFVEPGVIERLQEMTHLTSD